MGLDAFFYRHTKSKECDNIDGKEWLDLFSDCDELKDLIVKLKIIARKEGSSLGKILCDALNEYVNHNGEGNQRFCNSILDFRKFYFLNEYFHYNDDWYDKDMVITKDQCIELRDKAKACIDEIEKVSKEKGVVICSYNYGANAYFTQSTEKVAFATNVTFVDDIIYKHFPCEYKPKGIDLYSKILNLYRGMNEIISETDWDNEEIIYTADW